MNKKQIIILLALLIIASNIYCQISGISNKIESRHHLKYAGKSELIGDHITAIKYYEKYLELNPAQTKVISKLANQYFAINEFTEASNLYLQLIELNYNISENQFKYGLCQKNNGQYEPAMEYFQKSRKGSADGELKKQIKSEIKSCEFALQSISDPKNIDMTHLKQAINDVRSEFSPIFLNDTTIIYSQVDPTQTIEFSIYDTIALPVSKLYYANYKNNAWIKGEPLPLQINIENYNVVNGTLSPDRKRFYYNICHKNWQYKNICAIYVSSYNNNSFSKAEKLNKTINNSNYTSSQPTVGNTYNPELEAIYFSSDRPGGKGGRDIWYTVYNKKRKTYSEPKNLGNKINTVNDEITPFYNISTKTLYYSSNGKTGLGGFDIYKSTGELRKWFPSKNIGYPFNTNADDLYFIINEKQNKGFIVSNRKGSFLLADKYCCYDLFFYKYKGIQQIALRGLLKATIDSTLEKYLKKGIISFQAQDSISQIDSRYAKNTIVSLYIQDYATNDSIYITSDTTNENGDYFFYADKDQDYSLVFHTKNEYKGQMKVSTKSDSLIDNKITLNPLNITYIPDDPLIIDNIYYGFNESNLSDLAKSILDVTLIELLKEKPNFSIEVSSHTDSVGDDNYNLRLSQKRADNVVRYLIRKGIQKDRLTSVGYGEELPIVPNSKPDGSDYPKGREKNRRTEFKILNIEVKTGMSFY